MQTYPESQKWPYILLLVGNLVGLTIFIGAAALMLLSSLLELVHPATGLSSNAGSYFIMACGLGFCALPFIPAGIYSLKRVGGKPILPALIRTVKIWQVVSVGAAWIGTTLLSDYLYNLFDLGWLVAAPFYLASISLPIALLVWIGTGGLPLGSRNRLWSTLGIGMTVGPFLAASLELIIYLGVFVIGVVIIFLNPDWLAIVQRLISQISGLTDINAIVPILAPYILNPAVIVAIFLVMSVITPLIEEAAKPILVWLTVKRLTSPTQGFALGVLSGAGFALVESLLASSTPDQGWGYLLAARAGGGLMHILASGLMGWAIVSAWQGKRLRLAGTYLLSVTIHGLWNCAAVMIELGSVQSFLKNGSSSNSLNALSLIGLGILGVMVLIILPTLLLVNRKLRSSLPEAAPRP